MTLKMYDYLFTAVSVISGIITICLAISAKSSAKKAESAAEFVKKRLISNKHIETITVLKHLYNQAVSQSRKLGPGVTTDKIKGINISEISESVAIFMENLSANKKSIFNDEDAFELFNTSIMEALSKLSSANSDTNIQSYGSDLYKLLIGISSLISSKATESLIDTNDIGKQ